MKWVIWTPVLVILFSVVAGPWGIGLFASLALLLLLSARFILYGAFALSGNRERRATERTPIEMQPEPGRASPRRGPAPHDDKQEAA